MERLKILYHICLQGNATPAETLEFRQLLADPENAELASKLVQEAFLTYKTTLKDISEDNAASVLQVIFNAGNMVTPADSQSSAEYVSSAAPASGLRPATRRFQFLKTTWVRYAAIILLITGAAMFLYEANKPRNEVSKVSSISSFDIPPGGNKAILTLSDGRTIVLDSMPDGTLASQGETRILKLGSGSIAYDPGAAGGEEIYNTISTPRGGQYHVVLPDGSKAWLNAASSITFPTAFAGKERRVKVTGEVYFEIKTNPALPFYASANGTEIQVLGTSFNVNAYPDEDNIKTTLLEGIVRINADKHLQDLLPGQQSQTTADGTIKLIKNADTKKVMAWKNGLFDFENATLPEVMRQVSRWYDVEVIYEKQVPAMTFLGKIQMDLSLSELLEVLKQAGVHFRLEEKRIVVLP